MYVFILIKNKISICNNILSLLGKKQKIDINIEFLYLLIYEIEQKI